MFWSIMVATRFAPKAAGRGFVRAVGASIVATNLCQIGRFLIDRDWKQLRQAA